MVIRSPWTVAILNQCLRRYFSPLPWRQGAASFQLETISAISYCLSLKTKRRGSEGNPPAMGTESKVPSTGWMGWLTNSSFILIEWFIFQQAPPRQVFASGFSDFLDDRVRTGTPEGNQKHHKHFIALQHPRQKIQDHAKSHDGG